MNYLKNSLIAIGVIAIAILTSISANASLLIEPHLGYNVSGGQAVYGTQKYDYTGAQYGARLGMQALGFMGGLDYTHSSFNLKNTTIATSASSTDASTQDDIGVFVGYNAPILIRGWIGYYFSTKLKYPSNTSDYYTGTATELGLGFTPMPLISLNVMYRMIAFSKAHYSDGTSGTVTYSPKEIVLGVSLPFTLL